MSTMIKSSKLYDPKFSWECSCCTTKIERRKLKHSAKRREARLWKREAWA